MIKKSLLIIVVIGTINFPTMSMNSEKPKILSLDIISQKQIPTDNVLIVLHDKVVYERTCTNRLGVPREGIAIEGSDNRPVHGKVKILNEKAKILCVLNPKVVGQALQFYDERNEIIKSGKKNSFPKAQLIYFDASEMPEETLEISLLSDEDWSNGRWFVKPYRDSQYIPVCSLRLADVKNRFGEHCIAKQGKALAYASDGIHRYLIDEVVVYHRN